MGEIWRMGRRCMTYQTPKAFFSRLALSIAQDSRSKCKFSRAPIKVGDLRVDFVVGGAKGEPSTTQACSLPRVTNFLKGVVSTSGIKVNPKGLRGFKSIPLNDKQRVIAVF